MEHSSLRPIVWLHVIPLYIVKIFDSIYWFQRSSWNKHNYLVFSLLI